MVPARPDDDTVERALRACLEDNPTAAVAAVAPDSLFMALPPDLAAYGHPTIAGRWSLDVVAEDDRDAVIALWERSLLAGSAHTSIELIDGGRGTMHLFDTTAWRACSILVIVPGVDMRARVAASPTPEVVIRPRYAVATRNERGAFVAIDDTLCELLRTSPEELAEWSPLDLIHPEDHKRAVDNWLDTMSAKGEPRRYRGRHRCGDGSWLWLEFTNHVRTVGASFEIVSEMVDISEEMATHEALRAREEFLHRLTSSLPVAVGQIDRDGTLAFANDRLTALLGTSDAAAQADLVAIVAPEQRPHLLDALDSVFRTGADVSIEVRTTPADSTTARVHRVGVCALRIGEEIVGALLSMTDVTESADLREALHHRATYDDLTGLHNRASIMALLSSALGRDHAFETGTAAIFIDLDGFKRINDELGHAAGDDVLVRLSRRLRAAVRRQDLVGRIGGDEFLVVCPEVADPTVAVDVAARVARSLAADLDVASTVVRSQASIGVAWAAHDTTPEDLIRAADAAMYASKRAGAGRPVLAGLVV